MMATIVAEIDGGRIDCRIKVSELIKIYPQITGDPMLSITKYRRNLEIAARKLIEQNRFEADGSIQIRPQDLQDSQ